MHNLQYIKVYEHRLQSHATAYIHTDRLRVEILILFLLQLPPPSHTLGSEDVDECNDPSTTLEPPNMCPHPHARPIRLGLHIFYPWVYSGFEYSAITVCF